MSNSEEPRSGISRRDVIKRGAIVGGTLVWAAPVVQSLGSKAAFGTTVDTHPGSDRCSCCLVLEIAGQGTKYTFNPAGCAALCRCLEGGGDAFTCLLSVGIGGIASFAPCTPGSTCVCP